MERGQERAEKMEEEVVAVVVGVVRLGGLGRLLVKGVMIEEVVLVVGAAGGEVVDALLAFVAAEMSLFVVVVVGPCC